MSLSLESFVPAEDRLFVPGDLVVPNDSVARVWNRSNVCEEAEVLVYVYASDVDRMMTVVSVDLSANNGYVLVIAKGVLGYVSLDRLIHAF